MIRNTGKVSQKLADGDLDNVAELTRDDDDRIKFSATPSLVPGLHNEPPDHDGMYSGLVLPKSQCTFLWRLSWLSLFTGIYALYRQHYDLAPVPLGVWLTSINYWRHADYSWRRYFDIIYVHLALVYQIIRAYKAHHATAYYILLAIGMSFYVIGVLFHKRGDTWLSTLCHGQVHILGNMSIFLLYSAYIRSISETVFYEWLQGV
jgi:hypothetical protein